MKDLWNVIKAILLVIVGLFALGYIVLVAVWKTAAWFGNAAWNAFIIGWRTGKHESLRG